jgi:ferredoxin
VRWRATRRYAEQRRSNNENILPHVVTDNCAHCRFTDCVSHCPVECFHGDAERLFIDPDVCIDCGACIPACPVHAIHDTFDLPDELIFWIEVNAENAKKLPVIRGRQEPLPTAVARRSELGF